MRPGDERPTVNESIPYAPLDLPRAIVGASDRFTFDRESIRKLDQACIEQCSLPGVALMENAATALLAAALAMFDAPPAGALIICGSGNNGGDGFALARRLTNIGVTAHIALLCDPDHVKGDAAINLRIIEAMKTPIVHVDPADTISALNAQLAALDAPTLLVDAIFGTGLTSPPRQPFLDAIGWLNEQAPRGGAAGRQCKILAVDLPSGLDCDTGAPIEPGKDDSVVHADVTVSLAGRKVGFDNPASRRFTGALATGDIGAPIELLERFGRPRQG